MANSEGKEQSAIPNQKLASSSSAPNASKRTSSSAWVNCQVGDTFVFGNYPQDANGRNQPIEWQVLRRDSDGLLVISKYALDCKNYNEGVRDITWSQCSLRKWLNSDFVNKAFDATERKQIKEVHLSNPNSKFDESVPGGPDTDDKVFLLSHDEAESLFADDDHRLCKPTEYAVANNAWVDEDSGACHGMCFWWLRSPGYSIGKALAVDGDGVCCSCNVNDDIFAVRPAFKIALYNSDGKEHSAIPNQKSASSAPRASERASCSAWVNCQVGDTFVFGNYPQGANGEIKPIEWQVLRRDSDGLLVISKYALDCQQYNEDRCAVTWSQCTLRKWLNSEFINKAFDASERQQIKEVHLQNPNGYWDNVPGGPDTDDKIFLLSYVEADSLFSDIEKLKCKPTEYAETNNAYVSDDGMCWWWLRSPGYLADFAACVLSSGCICGGGYVNLIGSTVRPAFKIAL